MPVCTARPTSALRETERLLRELGKRQKELERDIHELESRVSELTAALGDEENYRNGSVRDLTREYDEASAQLTSDFAEWEQVCEQIAELSEL